MINEEDLSKEDKLLIDLFENIPALEPHWDNPDLVQILRTGRERPLVEGEMLYKPGEAIKEVFLLIAGEVQEWQTVEQKNGKNTSTQPMIRIVQPGRWLGLFDLIYRRDHQSFARAETESKVIAFTSQEIFRILYLNPQLRSIFLPVETFNRLRTIPLLGSRMSLAFIGYLAEACRQPTVCKAGEVIYKMGDPVNFIYIIDQGQVRLRSEDGEQWLGNGSAFGFAELKTNLLYLTTPYDHDHSATALCETRLFRWPRAEFVQITGFSPEREGFKVREELYSVVQSLEIFKDYDDKVKARLMGYMGHHRIPHHHLIIQQGELADSLWVLMPRSHAMLYAKEGDQELQKTSASGVTFFNEVALRQRRPCTATLQAEPNSEWLSLNLEDFQRFLRSEKDKKLEDTLQVPKPPELVTHKKKEQFLEGLEPDEILVLLDRRHWSVLLGKLTLPAIIVLVALALWVTQPLFFSFAWVINWVLLFLTVVIAALTWWEWLDYSNDYIFVTNKRVAQQEKIIFFREERRVAPLEQILDINVEINTVWGNLWHYGTLIVKTASEDNNIIFDRLPNAEAVQEKIREEQNRRKITYDAGGKREIYNALERQLGLNLNLPKRVLPEEKSQTAEATNRQKLFANYQRERVVWRRHWVVLLRMATLPIILSFLFTVATLFFILSYVYASAPLWGVLAIPSGIINLYMWAWLWWQVQDWYNDTYELTTTEIIDIEMMPLSKFNLLLVPAYLLVPNLFFTREVRKASLGDLIDIRLYMANPLNYLLNYGDVLVQTAAQRGRFTFDSVGSPAHVMEEVRRRVAQFHERKRNAENRKRMEEVPVWLEMYERLGEEREIRNENTRHP